MAYKLQKNSLPLDKEIFLCGFKTFRADVLDDIFDVEFVEPVFVQLLGKLFVDGDFVLVLLILAAF